MKSIYELKWFKNSHHPDLIEALKLYLEYTEPAVRTDTKEIIHCIDTWNKEFEDSFYVLGFYYNNQLIGFCELAYFLQEKFIIVDYIVIHKNFRHNSTFYQFIDHIKFFAQEKNLEYNYVVVEIACYYEEHEPPESSKVLIRLLKMSHFNIVKCNYYLPRVGMNDFESEMRSIMMIFSMNKSNKIKKETFFQIVKAIYFKYYQRWHNIFSDEKEKLQYNKEIRNLISKMEKQLENKKIIELNGIDGLLPISNIESKSISKRILKIITSVILFGICLIIVGFFFTILKSEFGWDSNTASTIIVCSVALTLFFVAFIFENRSDLFSKTLGKLIAKL